jgi:hypothetical protein
VFTGSGFRDEGSGFRVQGSGFRVQGSGFRKKPKIHNHQQTERTLTRREREVGKPRLFSAGSVKKLEYAEIERLWVATIDWYQIRELDVVGVSSVAG